MAKVQYNPQQVPPFTQEVPSASNQILPATALHVQHLKENTLSQCTESLLQESHFLPHSPEGEQKKNDGERLKEEKNGKKGWVIIIVTSLLSCCMFFPQKRTE